MRSKADETLVIVETLICPMQGTILTDYETPIVRNSDRSDIQLGFNNRKI